MDVKQIEMQFLSQFPGGFDDETFLAETKRFKAKKAMSILENELSEALLKQHIEEGKTELLIAPTKKFISNIWMTSRYEKIGFQCYVKVLDNHELFFVLLYDVMYGDIEQAFDLFISLLNAYADFDPGSNSAKWPIISAFVYYTREDYYAVKPNTTKRIAKALGYDIHYKSRPNLETYSYINQMYNDFYKQSTLAKNKQHVDAILYYVYN